MRIVLIIIAIILILGYFNISLKAVVEKPATQESIGYVREGVSFVWTEYLSRPARYFWNNIFVNLLWSAFIENFDQIKQGKPPVNFQATDENSKAVLDRLIGDIKDLEPKPIE